MIEYDVIILESAINDIKDIVDYIEFECKSPLTALRYYEGLSNAIKWLQFGAGTLAVSRRLSNQYGVAMRQHYYKKIAILYSIGDTTVYVHNVIAQSLIK